MYKLGVAIPNYERILNNLVPTVQKYSWVLFCIVDDGSSDLVNDVNSKSLSKFDNVIYMHSVVNLGPGVTRISAVNLLADKCEYIAFLDSDDELVDEGLIYIKETELTADIYGFKSIWKGEVYKSSPDVNDVNCELFHKVMRSDFLTKALSNYVGYSPKYGEDIEMTYLIKYSCSTWVQVDKMMSRSNVSRVGITNNIYHNFEILRTTVNDLFEAAKKSSNVKILSDRYLLAIELIISGYRRHHEEYTYELSDKY